jgi:3-hydroxyacyl-[acyl-carrier-protein] dehydratase
MLKDSLYTIQKTSAEHNSVEVVVNLNEQHEIFKGHFPSQPVLPGVCMLQMTKEMLELSLEKKLRLLKADDIRFSARVVPVINKQLKFVIHYSLTETQSLKINAQIINETDVVCFKLKASFRG